MAEHRGMIGTGAEPAHEPEIASGARRGDTHCAEKILAAEMHRAAESHQKTAMRHRQHRDAIEFSVEMRCARHVFEAAREWRWIDHHQIEALTALPEVLRRF